jgi:membrane-bound metal-dependent hydrolase YbcI (DUF457 family)
MSLPTAMVLFNLNQQSVYVLVYFLGGIMLGSLLPDVDASDAKIMHGGWRAIGVFGKYLFYRPMTWALARRSDAFGDEHRGYLHSLLGCLLATLYFTLPMTLLFVVLTYLYTVPLTQTLLFWWAWVGMPFGFLMHLAEDTFTKSGVRWFFPRGRPYRGTTRTGKRSEYNLLTAFLLTYGILTVIVWLQPPTLTILLLAILASFILLTMLYAVNSLISKFSKEPA